MAKAAQHPQLSHDALLIHGVMILFAAGTVAAYRLLPFPEYGDERVGAMAVGLPATAVLWAWSFVLALRAWHKKEISRWPVVIIRLCILEAVAGLVGGIVLARQAPIGRAAEPWSWVEIFGAVFLSLPIVVPALCIVLRGWLEKKKD